MDDRAASPALAVVLMVALVVAGAATVFHLVPALEATRIPDAMLDAEIDDGWIDVRHLGGDPIEEAAVRTVADGVPRTHEPVTIPTGATVNVSRPVEPRWQVHIEVRVRDHAVHEELVRTGRRARSAPDLRPTARVQGDRMIATVTNVGASPTPDGKQTIVYFYVDGDDPTDRFDWSSNRNHTPDPVPPGGSFRRVRSFDPSALDDGGHTLTVEVNINADDEPNLAETDYDNNDDSVSFTV